MSRDGLRAYYVSNHLAVLHPCIPTASCQLPIYQSSKRLPPLCKFNSMSLAQPLASLRSSQHTHSSTRSRISNIKHQYICRPTSRQLIHSARYSLFRHHRTDRRPLRIVQCLDRRCPFSGCDFCGFFEETPGNVVYAEDIFLCGCRGWVLAETC